MGMTRFFEILPGALAWATLIGMAVASWKMPVFAAVFIILFDIYWLLKTIYLSFHLRATYSAMRKNLRTPWLKKLKEEAEAHASREGIGAENGTGNGESSAAAAPASSDAPRRGEHAASHPALRWTDVWHLVIFPMHTEPHEVVRESFAALARTNYPLERLLVVLATEESGGAGAAATAKKIEEEFGARFGAFLVTTHPKGLAGEIPGKGSNQAWAARRAKEKLLDVPREGCPRGIAYDRVMVSVFDIDTQVFPEYFGRLTHAFLATPAHARLRAVYQPVPLFTNNIYEAPALARIVSFSSTFWQMMQQARPERLTTFSSQSVPFQVLLDMGYWHTNVVSEDSRIFWQGYLAYHGDFRVIPLAYPVSMDANVAPTFFGTLKNIYKQQRRWGWGAENIPYMLEGFRRDRLIPFRRKLYWTFNVFEGFHSWATNALMIFALGWLPVMLGGEVFNATLLSYNLPRLTRFIVNLSMLGVSTTAILSILLLPPKPVGAPRTRWWEYGLYFLQWILIPITLIVFGAIPGLEAQTRLMLGGRWRLGFWVTPKGRYKKI